MTLTNSLIKLFLFLSTVLGSSNSVIKSYETLKNRSEPTHATPHINNLIRNGLGQLNKDEKDELSKSLENRKKDIITTDESKEYQKDIKQSK